MPIRGAGGNDTLLGFGGNDWLNGAYGNNSLNGGAGQDLINGGPGADTLAGGLDADTFQFVSQYDSAGSDPSAIDYANTDVILDFSPRLGDKIDVQYVDANVLMPGDQAFDFNGVAAFTAPGQVSHFTDGTDTYPPVQHRRCLYGQQLSGLRVRDQARWAAHARSGLF